MARTNRTYHDRMCLRKPCSLNQWKAKAAVADINEELSEFGVRLRNRDAHRALGNAWDDKSVAALSETKHIWKAG